MRLAQLRWVAFLVPTILMVAFQWLLHVIDPSRAQSAVSLIAETTVVACGAYLFTSWIFQVLTQREESLAAKQAQVTALNQTAINISQELELTALLQRVADSARELLRAEYCALQVMPGNEYRPIMMTSGMSEEIKELLPHPPHGRGVLSLVLQSRRPVRVPVIAEHPAAVGFPPGHPPMTSFLGVPIFSRNQVLGNLYLSNKLSAPEFSEADEEVAETLASQAAVAIENARLFDRSRRTGAFLTSVITASHDAIVVLGADGEVRLWNRGAEIIYGLTEAVAVGQVLPMVTPAQREDELAFLKEALESGAVTGREALHCREDGSLVPVMVTLSRIDSEGNGQTGLVMVAKDMTQTRHLEAQRRRLVLLEERERISMDLHDGAIQALYAVGLGLGTTRLLLPGEAAQARDRLGQGLDQINGVIRQLREYIVHLRPPETWRRLGDSLAHIADRLREDGMLSVALDLQGDLERVSGEISVQFLHIAGEAASNVLRHAAATEVHIALTVEPDQVCLTIRDNGRGFESAEVIGHDGMGLNNLKARAQQLGGRCGVISAVGRGTLVRVTVPLGEKELKR